MSAPIPVIPELPRDWRPMYWTSQRPTILARFPVPVFDWSGPQPLTAFVQTGGEVFGEHLYGCRIRTGRTTTGGYSYVHWYTTKRAADLGMNGPLYLIGRDDTGYVWTPMPAPLSPDAARIAEGAAKLPKWHRVRYDRLTSDADRRAFLAWFGDRLGFDVDADEERAELIAATGRDPFNPSKED
jgi:hypothetical protein